MILPSVALAQGFGRIGCFLAGCCYGKETESVFSVIFQNSEYAPNHVALIPMQLYSGGLDFLHFLLLLLIARNKKEDGQVTACYLIFYSIGRFVIEFFRGDIIRGNFVDFPVYQYFYRDCGDRAADTDQEKKRQQEQCLNGSGKSHVSGKSWTIVV